MIRYDEPARLKELADLSVKARVAFAMLCATRILPSYRRMHAKNGKGDPAAVEAHAENLWAHLAGTEMPRAALESALEACMELIPTEDDEDWDVDTYPYAQDAVIALAYGYRTALSGEVQEAAWASVTLYNAMDEFAGRTERTDYDEAWRRGHPAVQSELTRQARDIADLKALSASADFALLRLRAVDDAATAFPA